MEREYNKSNSVKVSVIIPVYNSMPYLIKCMDSVLFQTLKDIEIICVNDGSTDNSLAILEKYASRDFRIKVYSQPNKKQGAARNFGMQFASGEYVGFVDADDRIDFDFYEKLYNTACKYDADVAIASNIRTGNGRTKSRVDIKAEICVTEFQAKSDISKLYKDVCPTNKIYRRELLNEHGIKFSEGVYCEDKIFTTQAIYWSNKLVTVPGVNYYYYRNKMSTVLKRRDNRNHLYDRNNARIKVLEFLKSQNVTVRDKDYWATKRDFNYFGINWYSIKESTRSEKHFLLGLIPVKEVIV